MCAIIGAMFPDLKTDNDVLQANLQLNLLMQKGRERGRDGWGYTLVGSVGNKVVKNIQRNELHEPWKLLEIIPMGARGAFSFICNLRAEPTTEYVAEKFKHDQQPYSLDPWHIVHNGTIANDKGLRASYRDSLGNPEIYPHINTPIDSSAIVETLKMLNDDNWGYRESFRIMVDMLVGSYAILALSESNPREMHLACNYRPIWAYQSPIGVFFASAEHYFNYDRNGFNRPFLLEPYTGYNVQAYDGELHIDSYPLKREYNKKALVVCSGGLDSVVAATYVKNVEKMDVTLIHFKYGSRAEGPEIEAVKKVAERLDVPLVLFDLPVYDKNDSPLLQQDGGIAEGETGAEFAHEWVPARNLVLLSVATAYAEAKGFTRIILGNNLEEAGAYPDNEPEFINRLNETLNFAVGDGKRVFIEMPVGNLMKHEIVEMGHEIGAPLDVTWSCYNSGELHCGHCGPCFMRKTAFDINKIPEVIKYEK